jgi:hypothetical protein
MSIEVPLQQDMFTGGLVDNRSRAQKREARLRQLPQQPLLFRQRDVAQFGVKPKPLISLSPHTQLALDQEDPRTAEQKERDLLASAQAQTFELPKPRAGRPCTVGKTPQGVQLRLPQIKRPERPTVIFASGVRVRAGRQAAEGLS